MTCKEIGEYITQQKEHEKSKDIMESSIQYRIAEFMVSITSARKPKILKYDELFPDLIDKQDKEELIQAIWKDFLGV